MCSVTTTLLLLRNRHDSVLRSFGGKVEESFLVFFYLFRGLLLYSRICFGKNSFQGSFIFNGTVRSPLARAPRPSFTTALFAKARVTESSLSITFKDNVFGAEGITCAKVALVSETSFKPFSWKSAKHIISSYLWTSYLYTEDSFSKHKNITKVIGPHTGIGYQTTTWI